jgi:hypothetical protein
MNGELEDSCKQIHVHVFIFIRLCVSGGEENKILRKTVEDLEQVLQEKSQVGHCCRSLMSELSVICGSHLRYC